jgi:3-hydroxybutyryl-CoA dehydrogenase
MNMRARFISSAGSSKSFPDGDPFLQNSDDASDVIVVIGKDTRSALNKIDDAKSRVVLVELDDECLGVATGEDFGREGSKVVGFSRYRIGAETLTNTIELVVQPQTNPGARDAATRLLEAADFTVVVCNDAPGRILDRLMRPYFNRALDALDAQLATPEGLDKAVSLGLGFRRGPVALLATEGLTHHFDVTSHLYAALGDPSYLPARRARVAQERPTEESGS